MKKKNKKRRINYRNLFIVIAGVGLFMYLIVSFISALFAPNHPVANTDPQVICSQEDDTNKVAEENKKIIFIDPGHGGYDSGGFNSDGTIYEKDVALEIAQLTGAKLEKAGYKVVYSRESDDVSWPNDNVADLSKRASMANASGAELMISLHLNSGLDFNDGSGGTEVWMYENNAVNYTLAENIQNSIVSIGFGSDRGVRNALMSPLQLLLETNIPACLVEVGFISNDEEITYITSEKGKNKIAQAIADGVIQTIETW